MAGLTRIVSYLSARGAGFEVIVVDDGSSDSTKPIAEQYAGVDNRVRCFSLGRNRGKGTAVAHGILQACGDWILVTDVDLSTPIEELERLEAYRGSADVIIGSRALQASRLDVRQPALREWLGRLFNKAVRVVSLPGIYDTQCGFKLWSRPAAKAVFPRVRVGRFAFDVESLWLGRRRGFRIKEVPVCWRHDPGSTVRLGRDGVRMGCDLLRLLLRRVIGD